MSINQLNRTYLFVLQSFAALLLFVFSVSPALAAEERLLIASLSSHSSKEYLQVIEGFQQQVVESFPKVEFVRYTLQKKPEENDLIVQEINSYKPALLLTLGAKATGAGLDGIPDIPLVAAMILNEKVLAQSGRATGVLLSYPPDVQMKWLHRFLPGVNHAGMLYNPEENSLLVSAMKKAGRDAGVEIEAISVGSIKELPAALKSLGRRVDMLLGAPDQIVYSGKTAKAVLLSTLRNRVPFAGLSHSWVKAGALYALTWDYLDMGRQSGVLAGKILSGTAVADIPPVTPEKVCYEVNLRTAEHLRLSIDPVLVQGAVEVYR